MKKYILIFSTIILVIIGITLLISNDEPDFLKQEGLSGLPTVQMVELLEARTIDPNHYIASIFGTELKITTQTDVYVFSVPDHLFYLSIAPYINQTHPCAIHNLTTCRGELKNQTFDVYIIDSNQNVIMETQVTTQDNGFAGIWLPRNIEGTITVYYQGKEVTQQFSTYDESYTCLTTLPLT